ASPLYDSDRHRGPHADKAIQVLVQPGVTDEHNFARLINCFLEIAPVCGQHRGRRYNCRLMLKMGQDNMRTYEISSEQLALPKLNDLLITINKQWRSMQMKVIPELPPPFSDEVLFGEAGINH